MANPNKKPDLLELGKSLTERGPVKILPTSRRVRILYRDVYIVDTTSALYVWEHEYYPYYYVPATSFDSECKLVPHTKPDTKDPHYWTAKLTGLSQTTDRILVFSDKTTQPQKALKGMVRVEFGIADAWFEEDVPIYVHPKDPFRRVDVLHSTRPLKIYVCGTLVAKTNSAYHLYETGLPCRYYVPATAVDRPALFESETTTACPYKGVANYYGVRVLINKEREASRIERLHDLVWYYKTPTLECANIAGFLCFYQEHESVVIKLDGRELPRPKTPWP
ncbi:DUF427-domain-containing protein [Jackrogersella minutella]|nr:DUF427-domain-containing protein [Jackrogersella minutella]